MTAITKKEHWAKLYRRALFEGDHHRLPLMLEQAHHAVQRRVRELRSSTTQGQDEKERHDLDAAAHYLGLLRSLKPSIGLVCHRRSSTEGPPRYGFGKRETIRGIGEIEQVDAV